jgi:hypothetical protein
MIEPSDLVGAWRSAGQDLLHQDGSISHPMGTAPAGRIIYTADGHVMVISLGQRDVPATDPASLTEAQRAACADGCIAYSGRYRFHGEQLLHQIDLAIFPAWMGQTRVRIPSLEGDKLTLTMLPDAEGAIGRVYWVREAG